jgi:hypothetical protein
MSENVIDQLIPQTKHPIYMYTLKILREALVRLHRLAAVTTGIRLFVECILSGTRQIILCRVALSAK